MRTILALSSTAVCAVALSLAASFPPGETQTVRAEPTSPATVPAPDPLIMHEWGTFTSFSGSDGVKLEFRPLVDNDLPPFVLDRARQSGLPNPWSKSYFSVLQRMETPVTYFYTQRERQVRVRVGFPQGLLTEFYPPVAKMLPEFSWTNQKETPVRDSSLDWGQVWLIPESHLKTHIANPALRDQIEQTITNRLVPRAANENHYVYARETDSALVYVRHAADPKRSLLPAGDFFEKFLFYRGIGNFELPLQLQSLGEDRFELANSGPEPIRSLFLVTVDGDRLRYRSYEGIDAGGRLVLELPAETASVDQLAADVVAALVEERLYEKEARAMVKTWRSSWFGEQGTRLFYMLPTPMTDTLLPLEITPRPDESVRVMVGRMEIMTPEAEARMTELVRTSAAEYLDWIRKVNMKGNENIPAPEFPQAIADMGRLTEPALVRVKHIAEDENVRTEADRLLKVLEATRTAETEQSSEATAQTAG